MIQQTPLRQCPYASKLPSVALIGGVFALITCWVPIIGPVTALIGVALSVTALSQVPDVRATSAVGLALSVMAVIGAAASTWLAIAAALEPKEVPERIPIRLALRSK